jgi:hypothetical protein
LPISLCLFHFLAGLVFSTIPAKLNAYFFYSAGDKRTADRHSPRAFTSTALTRGFGLITRAQSTGKPAYSYFSILNFHFQFIVQQDEFRFNPQVNLLTLAAGQVSALLLKH